MAARLASAAMLTVNSTSPAVFVLDFGNAFHVVGFGAHGQPDDQGQIRPDPGIPADEDFAEDRIGRSQNACRDAKGGGGGQARVGAGEEGHGDSL